MSEEWPYAEETAIGHHVAARVKPKAPLTKQLHVALENLGVEPRQRTYIEIRQSDVSWDESKTMTFRLATLKEIVATFSGDDVSDVLSEMTGRPSEEFEPDEDIEYPCPDELESVCDTEDDDVPNFTGQMVFEGDFEGEGE